MYQSITRHGSEQRRCIKRARRQGSLLSRLVWHQKTERIALGDDETGRDRYRSDKQQHESAISEQVDRPVSRIVTVRIAEVPCARALVRDIPSRFS